MSYEAICVSRVRFLAIQRENGTRGQLYVVWRSYREAFIAQTLPPLIKLVTKLTNVKLATSSFYRILRAQTRKPYSKGFCIKNLPSFEELNQFLEQFERLIVYSMDFDKWELDPVSFQENKDGSPSPQGTKIQL
jgi:hypothetical protein